jgi:hypothetical protein
MAVLIEHSSELNEEEQVKAFQALLSKCLNLGRKDNFLVIYDESLTDFLEALERAVVTDSVSTTLIFLPRRYQEFLMRDSRSRGGSDKIDLPASIIAAIAASTAILNILDATPDNAPVRKAVNHTPRPQNCRLATIPGVSADVLRAILQAPTDDIVSACEEMAWLLGEATSAELSSFDSQEREYRLTLELGGWENEPVMSPGVLLPGSWGNVPPGETFCCPPHTTVDGSICINGSIPGHVISPGNEVILQFRNGKLTAWTGAQRPHVPALEFFQRQKERGASNKDEHWNTFAELGIGLNPRITELTGNPLFDEKAIRTVHIAIGDNSVFGDDVSSYIHEDLVTREPSLRLNGQLVMDRGTINRSLVATLRGKGASLPDELVLGDAVIHLREGRIGLHNGVLSRRLSKAQRVNYVRMTSDAITEALNELCESLRTFHTVHIAAFLKINPTFGGISTGRLLNVLHHYRVLGVSPTTPTRSPL